MLSFLKFKSKSVTGAAGVEVQADGISLAVSTLGENGAPKISQSLYRPCKAADRKAALNEMVSELGADGLSCHVVLPPGQFKTYPIEKPKVEDAELADAVRWKVKDLLDFDLADAVTDVYESPADSLRGRPAQVNVVVSKSKVIQELVDLINQSGLELASIDIVDFAIRNVEHLISENNDRPIAVLYLRSGAGMMVLAKGSDVYLSRYFDFSSQALNEPSQQSTVIQQLALEVQRSFDYFESQMGQVPPQTIYLLGPNPNLPLTNMLGGSIAATAELLDLSPLFIESKVCGLNEINTFAAMGGALRGFES